MINPHFCLSYQCMGLGCLMKQSFSCWFITLRCLNNMKQSFSMVFVVSLPGRRISDITLSFLTIIPRARMGSESIAYKAKAE